MKVLRIQAVQQAGDVVVAGQGKTVGREGGGPKVQGIEFGQGLYRFVAMHADAYAGVA